jgi:hypothetical protein
LKNSWLLAGRRAVALALRPVSAWRPISSQKLAFKPPPISFGFMKLSIFYGDMSAEAPSPPRQSQGGS